MYSTASPYVIEKERLINLLKDYYKYSDSWFWKQPMKVLYALFNKKCNKNGK